MSISITRPIYCRDQNQIPDTYDTSEYYLNNDEFYYTFNLAVERTLGNLNDGLNDVYQELIRYDHFYQDITEAILIYVFNIYENSDFYDAYVNELITDIDFIFEAFGFANFNEEQNLLIDFILKRTLSDKVISHLNGTLPRYEVIIETTERLTNRKGKAMSTFYIKTTERLF